MRDVNVTVIGNVGADPVVRDTPNGRVTQFNLGTSPRFFDRETAEWRDGDTTWFRVACWREMGANVAESFRKGERVMVVGRLQVNTWQNKEGIDRTSVEITADHVGHDLTFGTTRYTRVIRTTPVPGPDDDRREAEDEPAYPVDADGVILGAEEELARA